MTKSVQTYTNIHTPPLRHTHTHKQRESKTKVSGIIKARAKQARRKEKQENRAILYCTICLSNGSKGLQPTKVSHTKYRCPLSERKPQ